MPIIKEEQTTYHVLKRGEEYFEDAWENLYNESLVDGNNHSFTNSLVHAYPFWGELDEYSIPKYLGDSKNVQIKTFQDMCDFLEVKPVKITRSVLLQEEE